MADNKLQIQISAADGVTPVVGRVNRALAAIAKPVAGIRSAVKDSGVEKLGKSLEEVGRKAFDAARAVTAVSAPLAALAGAGSIAGVAALANEWARLGSGLGRTSAATGIALDVLQQMGGAARMTGSSAEAMEGSLKSLGETMQGAVFGRNDEALALMNRLGITLHRTASGAVDSADAFRQLARYLAEVKPNPQVEQLIVGIFGIDPTLLPLLRKGPQGLAELEGQVRRLGGVMSGESVAAAADLRRSLTDLDIAAGGLRNAVVEQLTPVIQPLVVELTNWIAANRDIIATDVRGFVLEVSTAVRGMPWREIGEDVRAFGQGVSRVVELLGGWKNVAEGLLIFMVARWAIGMMIPIVKVGAALTGVIGKAGVALTRVNSLANAARLAGAAMALPGLIEAARRGGDYVAEEAEAAQRFGGRDTQGFQDWQRERSERLSNQTGQSMFGWIPGLGGVDWGKQREGLLSQWFGGKKPAGGAPGERQAAAMAFFQERGWSKAQAAGLVANLKAESGFDERAPGDHGQAFGIAQWHPDRQAAFARWAGKDIRQSSFEEQLGFVHHELTEGREALAGFRLRGAQTPEQAAAVVSRYYERPAATDAEALKRGGLARDIALGGGGPELGLPKLPAPAPVQVAAAPPAAAAPTQKVEIEISGLPAGARVKQRPGGDGASVRIGESMPTEATP